MSKRTLFFALFFMSPPVVAWSQSAENPQKPSVYVVKKGDCLWNISKRVWGDPLKWPLLFATNESLIKNPNLIYSGQKFKIPVTITQEELKKATELAQKRAVPLPAGQIGAEGATLKPGTQSQSTSSAGEPSPSSSASKLAPAAPPAASQENQPGTSASTTTPQNSSGSSSMVTIVVMALLALFGGIVYWFRKRPSETYQQPMPLSSFPQTGEPPVNKSAEPPAVSPSPVSASQAVPSNQAVPQNQLVTPPASPANPGPSLPPGPKAGGFTETSTSVSTSQPPLPSKAEPSDSPVSSTQLPLPAPSVPPAIKPPETKPPEGTQPPSTNP